MPNVVEDIRALPQVFRRPLVWLPFGLLLAAFAIALWTTFNGLPEGPVGQVAGLYVSLTLPPTSLFVFFIGGFVAPRASYLVGFLLGIFDAFLITLLFVLIPPTTSNLDLQNAGLVQADSGVLGIDAALPFWGIAPVVGVIAAGFAAWYRRFLRSSQERAKVNREMREQEQARKAKEQARLDKQAARESRKTR